ncbi:MAG: hypothetical protein IJS93_03520 [Clostridia bacterium]|nr:hypothetical protein [Clostridia bacterium]
MDINDRLIISSLFQEYGVLLTEKQREALRLYCDMDLSLFEIAEQEGVSRQAVRDSIKHAAASLFEYEEKLGLHKLREDILEVLSSDLTPEEKIERVRKLTE